MMVALDGDKYEVKALDLNGDQIMQHFCTRALDDAVAAMMVGLDRTTRPGQGTEFADVLTCFVYERADPSILSLRVRDQFRWGVINYQHQPRIVRPIDWNSVGARGQTASEHINRAGRRFGEQDRHCVRGADP